LNVIDKAYEFYVATDLSQYAGQWVAIVDEEVVASGDNARAVLDEARRKFPDCLPALAKIPREELLVLCLQ